MRVDGLEKMSLTPEERQRYLDEFAASIEQGQRIVRGKGQLVGPISMRVEGVNANLLLLEDRIRIQRKEEKTFLNQGFKGQKDILFSQISSVRLKRATTLGNGYIRFSVLGRDETGEIDPTRDKNTVMFRGARQAEFDKIKVAIETKMTTVRTAVYKPPLSAMSYIEELEQLAALRNKGIITEEEFAAKKRRILGI
ncbi:SHOCT domain-containing protein [Chloroflexota bacterium]